MKNYLFFFFAILSFLIASCAGSPQPANGTASPQGAGGGGQNASNDLYDKLGPVIEKTFDNLSTRLSPNLRIALLPPGSIDRGAGDFVFDELYIKFINSSRYRMVDRADIDKAIAEQNFGLTGLVSDDTAARIGHLLGAQVIVFGDMPEIGSARQRLVFRALEVETGLMLGMSSERF